MENGEIISGDCWLAYFDILGFENRVCHFTKQHGKGHLDIFVENNYEEVINYIEDELRKRTDFTSVEWHCSWFSDTFLFFAAADSKEAYLTIDFVAEKFFLKMVRNRRPLRGALTFGEFYAKKEKNIFVGPALIDAYRYGEKQKWIGLVLTPMARKRLKEIRPSLNGGSVDYADYDVPVKPLVSEEERLLTSRISRYGDLKMTIQQMQRETKSKNPEGYETKYKVIYENTLKFIQTTQMKSG